MIYIFFCGFFHAALIRHFCRFFSQPGSDENVKPSARLAQKKNIDEVLAGKQGLLLIPAGSHPEFSASRCTDAQLFAAKHVHELEPSQDSIFVRLFDSQRGLGTGSCGPQTLPKYHCTKEPVCEVSFLIKPIGFGGD